MRRILVHLAIAAATLVVGAALVELLMFQHGGVLAPAAVRLLPVGSDSHSARIANEALLTALLPLHLSDRELAGVILARSFMGADVRGFGAASRHHLGVPLEAVDRAQAATLVAISHAPTAYLHSRERLARRVAWLLASAR